MYYLKTPQNEVIRHAESLEKAKSLREMLLEKDILTVIHKNNRVVSI
jgi:hypothetical protein